MNKFFILIFKQILCRTIRKFSKSSLDGPGQVDCLVCPSIIGLTTIDDPCLWIYAQIDEVRKHDRRRVQDPHVRTREDVCVRIETCTFYCPNSCHKLINMNIVNQTNHYLVFKRLVLDEISWWICPPCERAVNTDGLASFIAFPGRRWLLQDLSTVNKTKWTSWYFVLRLTCQGQSLLHHTN